MAQNDRVAVMPLGAKSPQEIVRISHVTFVGDVFIQTSDGRMYATTDGADLYGTRCRYIVPATEEHELALAARTKSNG